MGLRDTLAGMAQSHDEANRDKDLLPIRVGNWQARVLDLYKTVLRLLADVDPQGRITSREQAFRANGSNPYGPYTSKTLLLDVFGKTIELTPFSSLHDEEVNSVHMAKVGRSERVRFLYRDNRWDLSIEPADHHQAYMEGRKPVWTYQPFTADTFNAALDFLLTKGETA